MVSARRAIFLDRDGVVIEDAGLVTRAEEIRLLPGAADALACLKAAGFALVVVTNQAVVARGLLTEAEVTALERLLEAQLRAASGVTLDGFYFCPHHPNATRPEYREVCACRKPRPGLLLRASGELGLDPTQSFMIGDRPTDLLAGQRAGCRTVWVQTGQHGAEPIQTGEALDAMPEPDFICDGLPSAAAWILEQP